MTDEKNLITIVVPVRNRAGIVTHTLDSIAAQSYRPLRLVVVDNASTDSTLEVIGGWASAHAAPDFDVTVVSEHKSGASAARNRGLKEVATGYVMFFDSDDTMEYDHLERIVEVLKRRPDVDMVHWSIAYRTPDGWTSVKDSSAPDDLLSEHLLHATLSTARYVVRTSLIRSVGGWNEELSTWDDYELGVRLLAATPVVLHLPGSPRVHALQWDESQTGPTFGSRAGAQLKALEAIESEMDSAPRHNLILASRKAVLAAMYCREGHGEMAGRMLGYALEGKNMVARMKLRLIYFVQRMAGRGASSLAAMLFPVPDNAE